jgi:site-specific recombinase XerD
MGGLALEGGTILRSKFATNLLAKTGNLRLVQRALVHERPQTTTIYAHVLDKEFQASFEGRLHAS